MANLQLGEALPDGTTVTFIDPSALEHAHILDPNTLEIQSAIQIPTSVNIEHVILEQPILDHLTGLQTSMGHVVAAGGDALAAAVEALPMGSVIEAVPVDIKPPVGKVRSFYLSLFLFSPPFCPIAGVSELIVSSHSGKALNVGMQVYFFSPQGLFCTPSDCDSHVT